LWVVLFVTHGWCNAAMADQGVAEIDARDEAGCGVKLEHATEVHRELGSIVRADQQDRCAGTAPDSQLRDYG
jgi:hypothetical protein